MFYPSVVKSISEYSANCSKTQLPAGWPHFAPLSFDQLIALLDSDNSQKTVVVVVEWPDSTTGREVMLRFGDGSLKSRQLSLYRTVYRSWEDAEILRWAPLLAEAGQLIPPFLLVMQGQQQHPKQLHFVLKYVLLTFFFLITFHALLFADHKTICRRSNRKMKPTTLAASSKGNCDKADSNCNI